MADQAELVADRFKEDRSTDHLQFKLWHIFYATALIAVCMSFSFWMLMPAVVWTLICGAASTSRKRVHRVRKLLGYSLLGIMFCCCFGGILAAPSVSRANHAAKRTMCVNNQRQIMLAMLNYESANRHFPAASETAEDGTPMHSWRVLILPFLDQQALYDQYDLSQPWDSPANLKLVDQMPDVYRCPFSAETSRTNFKLVVGPGSLFDAEEQTFAAIKDGSSNTIAIVEDAVNPVEWTRPSDVTIEQATKLLKPENYEDFPHVTDTKFETTFRPGNYARYDGSVEHSDCCELKSSEVRKLLGVDDGVSEDVLDPKYQAPKSVTKIAPGIALLIFLLLMLYPLSWVFGADPPNGAEDRDR